METRRRWERCALW